MFIEMETRTYTLRRRAERQQHTRERIVAATMALHEELGPRKATISAIAERAGVQRLTVYRHFPDETALFQACTTRWLELNPPPQPEAWQHEADAWPRLHTALLAFYRYYRGTERMWAVSHRDAEDVPALQAPMTRFEAHLDEVRDGLLAGLPLAAPDPRIAATLGHALRFGTWQSLDRQGLEDAGMAELVLRWLRCLASDSEGR